MIKEKSTKGKVVGQKPIRQIDVARRAGVARPTVSRILNNSIGNFSVRPEVRERVLKAAAELGYHPNVMARALRKNSSGLVGWLGSMYPLAFSSEFLNAFTRKLSPEGLLVSPSFTVHNQILLELPWWRMDAAVVTGAEIESSLQLIEEQAIPYISVNCQCGPSGASLSFDDEAGMVLACEHLLALGHRRIAFVMPDENHHRKHLSVSTRLEAYKKTLLAAGCKPLEPFRFYYQEDADAALSTALAEGVTAYIAYNAYSAVLLHSALLRRGLLIPKDASLLCFNDDELVAHFQPAFSVIRLNGDLAGKTAADMLLTWLANPSVKPAPIVLPEELILRASTAPLR